MQTFKQFIEEQRLNESTMRTKIGNWFIQMSKHALERAIERRPDVNIMSWRAMYKNMVDAAQKKDLKGEILFYSHKLRQGIVAAVDAAKNTIRLITKLPRGKAIAKSGTGKVFVEGYEDSDIQVIVID